MTDIPINNDILCKTSVMNGVVYLRFSNPRSGVSVLAGAEEVEKLHSCLKQFLQHNAPERVRSDLKLAHLKRDRSSSPIQFTIEGRLTNMEELAQGWVDGAVVTAVEAGLDPAKLPLPDGRVAGEQVAAGRISGLQMKRAFDVSYDSKELMAYLEFPMIIAFTMNAAQLPKTATAEDLRAEAVQFIAANQISWQDPNAHGAAVDLMVKQAEKFRAAERGAVIT